MHQGSMLSPFIFAVVVNVVTKFAGVGVLSELLYADDLVLMSDITDGLMSRLIKWKHAFVIKGLKVSLGKAKVFVVSSSPHQSPRCGV